MPESTQHPDGGFNVMDGRSRFTIPWGLAELLYPAYGNGQSLQRIHERGGFGREELGMLAVDRYLHGRGLKQMPLLDIYEHVPVAQAARLVDVDDPAIRREIADAIATRVNDRMLSWEAVADHVAERLKLLAALQKGAPE